MSTVPIPTYTPEQYLERERRAQTKSQYYRGEIFAMSGASREHILIAGNLHAALHNALRDRPCEVYTSDLRVKVQQSGLYTYPDVTVACGEPKFEDKHVDTLLNPLVLIEVLSESTEAYDRGAKSAQYRKLPSLRELVLVSSTGIQVEHYHRGEDGQWGFWETSDKTASLALTSVDITVPLEEIYRRVEFPPVSPATSETGTP
ncbi:MAG: Uma2 family endonuclease [Planctomycetaceae bacterium]|nr:Uma2 family endonuclease [Planctomycetaceae bacterium]